MRTDPEPELTLRPAVVADAAAVADLHLAARTAAQPAMPPPVHEPAEVRRHVAGTVLEPQGRETWVAETPTGLVGYAQLDGDWLDQLYVAPGHTGQGVGSALLDLVKARRPDGFALWVFRSNTRAQEFYRRHGLVVVRRTDGSDNEERAPDLEMAWFGSDPMRGIRRRIDAVDRRLAELLAERAALTAAAQRHKPTGGHAGRDPEREAAIVARMAEVADNLGADRLRRIMDRVIAESLDAAEDG